MPKCSFKFCKNLKPTDVLAKNDAIAYYRFPSRLIRREKWIEVTRRQRKEPSFKPNTGSLICSKHFDKSDMYTTDKGKLRLRDTAVPIIDTVNLNASIVEDKSEIVDDSFLTSEVVSKPSNDLVYQYSIRTNESNEQISTKLKINTSDLNIQFYDNDNTKCFTYENPFLPSTSNDSDDDSEDIGKIIKIEFEESSNNSNENDSVDGKIETDVRTLDLDKFGEHVAAMLKRIPVHKALELQPRILKLITSVMDEDQTKMITIEDKLYDEEQ